MYSLKERVSLRYGLEAEEELSDICKDIRHNFKGSMFLMNCTCTYGRKLKYACLSVISVLYIPV